MHEYVVEFILPAFIRSVLVIHSFIHKKEKSRTKKSTNRNANGRKSDEREREQKHEKYGG